MHAYVSFCKSLKSKFLNRTETAECKIVIGKADNDKVYHKLLKHLLFHFTLLKLSKIIRIGKTAINKINAFVVLSPLKSSYCLFRAKKERKA